MSWRWGVRLGLFAAMWGGIMLGFTFARDDGWYWWRGALAGMNFAVMVAGGVTVWLAVERGVREAAPADEIARRIIHELQTRMKAGEN